MWFENSIYAVNIMFSDGEISGKLYKMKPSTGSEKRYSSFEWYEPSWVKKTPVWSQMFSDTYSSSVSGECAGSVLST